jgi:hypothetical protein
MSDMIDQLRRRDPRYQIASDSPVEVVVTSGRDEPAATAQLINISISGAKIRVTSAHHVDDLIRLTMGVQQPPLEIAVEARVCWVQPAPAGKWYLGCAFTTPIAEQVLNTFASDGILDRRNSPREPLSIPALAQWELSDQQVEVTLLDFSTHGGCRLHSKVPADLGKRVCLTLPSSHGKRIEIFAHARWMREDDQGFLVGCEFQRASDSLRLLEWIELRNARSRPVLLQHRKTSLVAAAALVGLLVWLSLPCPSSSPGVPDSGAYRAQIAPHLAVPAIATPVEVGPSSLSSQATVDLTTPAPPPVPVAPRQPPRKAPTAATEPSIDPPTAAEALSAGRKDFAAGRYAQAQEALQAAIELDAEHAPARYLLAATYYQQEQLVLAEAHLREAVWLEREQPVADWLAEMSVCRGEVRKWLDATRREYQLARSNR